MILVVAEQLTLRLILMHQGKFLQTAQTAPEALRILRNTPGNLQGVILDDRIANAKLVAGYVRTHVPGIILVSMQVALRNSPFSDVPKAVGEVAVGQMPGEMRYVWERSYGSRRGR
jgi:hypothetical protein